MQFREWLLNEFPVSKFKKLGDWTPNAPKYGFHQDDIGILSSEKGQAKIIKKWSNSKENFELYFVRVPRGRTFVNKGEVDPEWIKENLKVDIPENLGAITIIYTNNIGDQRVALTSWILAHRFGHAIAGTEEWKYFENNVISDLRKMAHELYGQRKPFSYGEDRSKYDRFIKLLSQSLGTFRSARQGKIRNYNEFLYELLAQYVTTGHIKFNPPPRYIARRKAWGHPTDMLFANRDEMEYWVDAMPNLANNYEEILDQVMSGLVGRMFLI